MRACCCRWWGTNGVGAYFQQEKDVPKYVTLRARTEQITFARDESEEDLGLQVALSLDSMTSITRVQKKTTEDTIELNEEDFIFHMNGSPIGAMLLVKLLGVRRGLDTVELGTALFDLSTILVGAPSVQITCELATDIPREERPLVKLDLKLCPRRKSFSFSYLRDKPLFHCSGYTITAEGLMQFPQPYKKNGMPADLKFQDMRIVGKASWADDINGLEVFRAVDRRGGTYTIKKFSIMQTSCRDFLIASLDGLLDALPDTVVRLCDAFLIGAKVCLVLDEMGGVYLRDSLQESGACPEMVASIILRQVLTCVQYLHEQRSRLHMDIDARHILCMKNGECLLSGFCYSVKQMGIMGKFSGPFYHMSPERLLGLECSFPADVWSIGILAIELALGKGPYDMAKFQGPNGVFEFRKMVAETDSPTLKGVNSVSDVFRSFVTMCMHKHISARASPRELLAHPLIQKYATFLLPAGSWLSKTKNQKIPSVGINFQIERFGTGFSGASRLCKKI